jgi:tRNA threonylcarbamoyladenosine biosynthesis protein TsaE
MVDSPNTDAQGPQQRPPESSTRERTARTVFSLSDEETLEYGRALARALTGGELILLEGDLGLGKTVFARGIAVGLGIPAEDVNSPSFTLVQEYRGGRLVMYHVDLYRIEDMEEIATLGLEELVSAGAVTVVEWGDRLPSYYTADAIRVRLHDVSEGCRRIEISQPARPTPARRGDA